MRETSPTLFFAAFARRVWTYFLCFALFLTTLWPVDKVNAASFDGFDEEELRARFPDAQFIHIDPDSYPQLAADLREQGYVAANAVAASPSGRVSELPERHDRCAKEREQVTNDDSLQFVVDVTRGAFDGNGDNKSAAVVFVIIGAVLIVVWALYSFKFFYDSLAGIAPCDKWSDLSLINAFISADGADRARFSGLRYMTGLRHDATQFGLSLEAGHADIELDELALPHLEGAYWLLGPVMRWQLNNTANPSYFLMNFLAGSTEHRELGLLAQANVGLQFGFGSRMRIGLHAGAMKIDLHERDGIIAEGSQYYYLYGINLGYSF